ncbi:MAG: PDZ domain-containing protein [Candidatus Krumholzibacteria bacterium]|nr:PDZ domain-containing protein [Candidatus Krumholzibacteria bacterium]
MIIGKEGEDERSSKDCCAYMGVTLNELTARMRSKADYPYKTGVLISGVEKGSPAEMADLQENDIVYLFNGTKVEDSAELASLVRKQEPGDRVQLSIYRDGKENKITVILGKRELQKMVSEDFGKYSKELSRAMGDVGRSAAHLYRRARFMRGNLGMALADLNDDLAPYFNAKTGGGALIIDVEAESAAGKAGIKGGDVIVKLNGDAVAGVDDVIDALAELDKGDTASIEITRKGTRKTFELEVEGDFGSTQIYIAPFERGGADEESIDRRTPIKENESARLKEEMKDLKERLRKLEDRLNEEEKNR